MKKFYLCALSLLLMQGLFAQKSDSKYNQHEAFAPDFYTQSGNMYRSADGTPGPAYWQNRADYNIQVKLDTTAKTLKGSVEINYTNNSPDQLPYLWLYVDQNIYREDSRATATTDITGGRWATPVYTKGDEITSITLKMDGKSYQPKYRVSDTRLQILLPKALSAKGGKATIQIDYGFSIPERGTDRMGRMHTKNGWIYEIAQWYPRMCVYDDVEGWNTLPYLGAGEFYLEYGDIHYSITAPSNMVIVGSGTLDNPKDVLTKKQITQLDKAQNSDATVMIHSLEDVKTGKDRLNKKELTWKFSCLNTRDVAWAASKAFIWDAARIKMQSGNQILAQSVYPEESATTSGWDSSTYYTKRAIEINSYWHDFPYPVATNVAGTVGGMEYPGIVFCSARSTGPGLWFVTLHEFGHNWFPMLVGSNERKYAWMDEGINTFTNFYCSRIFNNGAYNNEPDKYRIARSFFKQGAEVPMTLPDVLQPANLGNEGYYKPAVGLLILRDVILGPERFDVAFKLYIKDWAYKHPTPADFFHSMENTAGEDLGWFWKGWFYNNWAIDQAVKSVNYTDDDPTKGALITLENVGQMPLPVQLDIQQENGQPIQMKLPVEIWQRGGQWTFHAKTTSKIKKVTLDPNRQYPDVDTTNNVWPNAASTAEAIPSGVTAQSIINNYINAVGGKSKMASVKSFHKTLEGSTSGTKLKVDIYYKAPDKFSEVVNLPEMNMEVMKIVLNGDKGTMTQQGKTQPLEGKMLENIKNSMGMFPELKYSDAGYELQAKDIREINGKKAYRVIISDPDGQVTTNYYDIESHLKIKSESPQNSAQFSDYRAVQGLKIPYDYITENMGHESKLTATKVEINSAIEDSVFQ